MSGIRIGTPALALALLAGVSGAATTARAQASGTLQASVTVIDDPVSRSVFEEVSRAVSALTIGEHPGVNGAIGVRLAGAAVASIVELEAVEERRRVRVEVVHF